MALDHPARIKSFTCLDVVPSQAAFENMDADLAFAWFHWHLMRQPSPLPETLIGSNAKVYLDFLLERWTAVEGSITDEAYAEYLRCFDNPDTVRATCLDYRASPSTSGTTRSTEGGSWNVRCSCCGART